MLFSVCTCCNQAKWVADFRTRFRNGYHQYRSWCKSCESAKQSVKNKQKMQDDPAYKVKSLERITEWGLENKQRRLEREAERRRDKYANDEDHRAKVCASVSGSRSRRNKSSKNFTLSDRDKRQINLIYSACAKVSKSTGKLHEVDHIVPLLGENVCGLHVPWNLAIIPKAMNRSKSNAFPNWGDAYLNP